MCLHVPDRPSCCTIFSGLFVWTLISKSIDMVFSFQARPCLQLPTCAFSISIPRNRWQNLCCPVEWPYLSLWFCLQTLSCNWGLVSSQSCGLLCLSDTVDPLLFVEGVTGLEIVVLKLSCSTIWHPEEVLGCETQSDRSDMSQIQLKLLNQLYLIGKKG